MKGIGRLHLGLIDDSKEVRIWIEDEGSGIASKDLKHLFRPGLLPKVEGGALAFPGASHRARLSQGIDLREGH